MTGDTMVLQSGEMPRWYDDAVCAQTDPSLFYPDQGAGTFEAKRICKNVCTVREECLTYAMDNEEAFGIWGGLSYPERVKLRRRRRLA